MTGSHPKTHLASSKGMTIIELMTVMVIIGLLAAIAIPKYEGFIEQARIARTIAEIRYLDRDIQAYVIANEQYPETLGDLHLSISNMLDPWGNTYKYLLIAPKGKKVVSIEGGGGIYYALSGMDDGTFYARNLWRLDFVAAGDESDEGSWSGSWFTSEAWAAPPSPPPTPPTPPSPPSPPAQPRKDRFLVPINADYDLYSMGADGKTAIPLTVPASHDDIIRAANGAFVGLAQNF